MKLNLFISALLFSTIFNAFADNAKTLTVKEEVVINAPAEGQDDVTAVKVITSVYQGGLVNLKKITE